MAKTSVLGYYETIDADRFAADEPVDSAATWTMMQNAQHLHDAFMQYRVHWLLEDYSENDTDIGRTDNLAEGYARPFVVRFPITVKSNGYPVGLDIRLGINVVTATGTPTHTVSFQVWVGSVLCHSGSGTNSATSGYAWVVDDIYQSPNAVATQKKATPMAADGFTALPDDGPYYEAMMLVHVTSNDATAEIGLCGMQVREYMDA